MGEKVLNWYLFGIGKFKNRLMDGFNLHDTYVHSPFQTQHAHSISIYHLTFGSCMALTHAGYTSL
jgi:hypothetical protein